MQLSKDLKKKQIVWIPLMLGAAYVAITIAFAVQTYELVQWLMPADNVFMKWATVLVFDGACVVWSLTRTFTKVYHKHVSQQIVNGMFWFSFALSTVASVIQLYLSSTTKLNFHVDPNIIAFAFGTVIVAFVANLVALVCYGHAEMSASNPAIVLEHQDGPFNGGVPVGDEQDFPVAQ